MKLDMEMGAFSAKLWKCRSGWSITIKKIKGDDTHYPGINGCSHKIAKF